MAEELVIDSEKINSIITTRDNRPMSDKVNELTAVCCDYPIVTMPLTHTFTDGLYTRKIFMPAGTLVISEKHNTRHPFFVLSGAVSVWIDEGEELYFEGGHSGITEAGTQRVLYIHKDCYWATVHLNPDNLTVAEMEAKILDKIDNPYLDERMKSILSDIKEDKVVNSVTIGYNQLNLQQ